MAIRGVLLDLKGVLYESGEPLDGAAKAVEALKSRSLALRYLTNTTTAPRREIAGRLNEMGIDVSPAEVFAPGPAAARLLRDKGLKRVHLAADERLAEDLEGFEFVEKEPDAVVLGDLGGAFTHDRLDRIFRMLLDGARLIALHKNRYSTGKDGLILDLGPYVAALEYAAAIKADVVGKPSRSFFTLTLADMGLEADTALMVGDDLEADIGGGQQAGLVSVQVRTGKFRPEDENRDDIAPDHRIDGIADLPKLIDGLF